MCPVYTATQKKSELPPGNPRLAGELQKTEQREDSGPANQLSTTLLKRRR
jgi:hypothetical protein